MRKCVIILGMISLLMAGGCRIQENENHQIDIPVMIDPYEGYKKTDELYAEHADVTTLIRFDGILYAKSYALLDYAGGGEKLGTIDKLIDKEYVPKYDNETNTEEILNAEVYDKCEKSIVLFYGNIYHLFELIEE